MQALESEVNDAGQNQGLLRKEISTINTGLVLVGLGFLLDYGSLQGLYNDAIQTLLIPMIIIIAVICYVVWAVLNGKIAWRKSVWIISVFMIGYCIYIMTSTESSIAQTTGIKLFSGYLASYLLIVAAATSTVQVMFLLDMFLLAIAYSCFHGIMQGGLVWSSMWLSDENQFAVVCCMALSFSLSLLATKISTKRRTVYILVSLLYFAGIVRASSRGGFLALAVIMGIQFLRSRSKLKYVLVGICIVGISIILSPPKAVHELEMMFVDEQAGTSAERPYLWKLGIMMFRDHPLIGVGPFNYSEHFLQYDRNYENRDKTGGINWKGQAWVAHSTPITFLAETGVVGVGFLLLMHYVILKELRVSKHDSNLPIELVSLGVGIRNGAVTAIGSFWVSSCFLTLTWFPFLYTLLAFGSVAGWVGRIGRKG